MKRWLFWLGILISIIFMYFALSKLSLDQVWGSLKKAEFWWLIPGVAVYFVAVWARAWRWHYLLRPIKKIPTRTMFPVVAIGYMGNNIYPYRAGEVLRAAVLKNREGVAISASLATVIVERIFDSVVMLGFVFFNLSELSTLTGDSGFIGDIQSLSIWGSVLFIGALVVFLLAAMFHRTTARIVDWVIAHLVPVRFRQAASGLAHRFLDGLEALRSPQEVLMVFVTSIVIWLLETGKYWFVMHAFGLKLSFFALMLMNGIVNLAGILPSAPGSLGTFDLPGIAVLQAYGVDKPTAVGYTLLLHAALWFPITALGAYYFFKREGKEWRGKIPTSVSEGSV
jgi:glycosyltransferase 2 family protein